jgi:hypothetical protein
MIVRGKNTIPNMASIILISILRVFDWLNKKKEFKKIKILIPIYSFLVYTFFK